MTVSGERNVQMLYSMWQQRAGLLECFSGGFIVLKQLDCLNFSQSYE